MDVAPPGGSSEYLQSSVPGDYTADTGHSPETLIGPPGLHGNQFIHIYRHDGEDAPQSDASANIRKKFKAVLNPTLNRAEYAGGE